MAGIKLKKAEPETVGLSKERITEFVGRLHEAEIPLHSMIVIKDDRLVLRHIRSLTDRMSFIECSL